MNTKVERYLDRAFEDVPEAPKSGALIAFLMPAVALGLACWHWFAGGPAGALTSAHALIWVFIILNTLAGCLMWLGTFGREFLKPDHPVTYDRGLFASKRRGSFLAKFISRTDVLAWLTLAIMTAWPVAIVVLCLQGFGEIVLAHVNASVRRDRLKELEKMDEAQLHSFFATKEEEDAVGQDIDNMFRIDL